LGPGSADIIPINKCTKHQQTKITNYKQENRQVRPDDPKLLKLSGMLEIDNWKDKAIPLVLHGDGGRFTQKNKNSLLCLSWKPLLARNFSLSIFLLTVLPKVIRTTMKKHNMASDTECWIAISDFSNAFFEGKHSRKHPKTKMPWDPDTPQGKLAGQLLCDGNFFGVVWHLTGDMEYNSNELKIPHFNGLYPCVFCPCDAKHTDLSTPKVTDVRLTAPWKTKLIPVELGCVRKLSGHLIWTIYGVHRFHQTGDLMHHSCLGVLLYLLGAVLWELLYDCDKFTGTIENRMQQIWDLISEIYTDLKTPLRLTHLVTTMFLNPDDYPCLSCKAAESRHLLPVMIEVSV